MSSEEAFAHVADQITRLLPEAEDDVRSESELEADLGMDSIHLIDLVTNIERTLGISIPDTRTESFKDVADIVDAVAEYSAVV